MVDQNVTRKQKTENLTIQLRLKGLNYLQSWFLVREALARAIVMDQNVTRKKKNVRNPIVLRSLKGPYLAANQKIGIYHVIFECSAQVRKRAADV